MVLWSEELRLGNIAVHVETQAWNTSDKAARLCFPTPLIALAPIIRHSCLQGKSSIPYIPFHFNEIEASKSRLAVSPLSVGGGIQQVCYQETNTLA